MFDLEEWRPIPEFPGYEASSIGRIRSTHLRDRWGNLKVRDVPFVLKLNKLRTGYLSIDARDFSGRKRKLLAHRGVALAWLGVPHENKQCVGHLDGNRSNNRPSNLSWVSYSENESHKFFHGTVKVGSAIHCSKLTDGKVIDLRKRRAAGESLYSLSKEYGIALNTAKEIVAGGTWKHLPTFSLIQAKREDK